MNVDVEQLRVEVYRTFTQTGRPPTVDELADEVAGETTEIRAALRQLARGRHLSLDVDDAIVMAHPFSAVPLGFSVMSNATLWWADVPGTPSPCRICSVSYCPAPHRSWSRPRARPATARTSGASTAAALPMESRPVTLRHGLEHGTLQHPRRSGPPSQGQLHRGVDIESVGKDRTDSAQGVGARLGAQHEVRRDGGQSSHEVRGRRRHDPRQVALNGVDQAVGRRHVIDRPWVTDGSIVVGQHLRFDLVDRREQVRVFELGRPAEQREHTSGNEQLDLDEGGARPSGAVVSMSRGDPAR